MKNSKLGRTFWNNEKGFYEIFAFHESKTIESECLPNFHVIADGFQFLHRYVYFLRNNCAWAICILPDSELIDSDSSRLASGISPITFVLGSKRMISLNSNLFLCVRDFQNILKG
jgi:hypothetical protein